jgi:Zn finger protein HypA/HybF involved in hydrogenase expression
MGRPFAAIIKMTPDLKVEFDFGQDSENQANGDAPDFSGREPFGKCPHCGSAVYDDAMNYICEKAAKRDGCSFRTGKVILQRPLEVEQAHKLVTTGRTDFLDKFISKKGRPFTARLVVGEAGKVGFEFEPRAPKKPGAGGSSAKTAVPAQKIDLTKLPEVATCPVCGARLLESESEYVCEKSQAEKKPCKFKAKRAILQQPLDRAQIAKLTSEGRTDLLTGFISKAGKPFSAFLVLDGAKIGFEFPPR